MAAPLRPDLARPDLARLVFSLIVLALLIGGSMYVLQPFLPALVWATMIVVSTWPLMLKVQAHLRGSRALATGLMLIAMLLVIVLPILVAVTTVVEHTETVRAKVQALQTADLPPVPTWIEKLPLVGKKVAGEWQTLVDSGADGLRSRVAPYTKAAFAWFVSKAGSLGMLGLHFVLTLAIAGILYMHGETAAAGIIRFARRLGNQRGENAIVLAGQAIRAVAVGIVVTALIQSLLGGLGLAICGVPGATALTGLMFLLCIAQVGPFLVLAPSVGWLFWSGQTGWGILLLVFSVLAVSLDNVVRPILIKRGADLPMLLIVVGVIGGMLAFGLVGLFVGPGLLAVAYTLLNAWLDEGEPDPESDPAS